MATLRKSCFMQDIIGVVWTRSMDVGDSQTFSSKGKYEEKPKSSHIRESLKRVQTPNGFLLCQPQKGQ